MTNLTDPTMHDPQLAGGDRLRHLLQRIRFNLHLELRIAGPRSPHRSHNGIGRFVLQHRQVVILNQHHIKQTETVIPSAAAGDRVFFQPAPSRRGLAGIEYFRARTPDGRNELRG